MLNEYNGAITFLLQMNVLSGQYVHLQKKGDGSVVFIQHRLSVLISVDSLRVSYPCSPIMYLGGDRHNDMS